jgi:GxxExxY protein
MQSIAAGVSHGNHGKHGRMYGKPGVAGEIISQCAANAVKCLMINEELTFKIRGAIYSVFKELGPGLFESVYEKTLAIELQQVSLKVVSQVPIKAAYKGQDLDLGFRLDMLIEDRIIVEIKSIEQLHDVHKKQLLTYLKLTGMRVGILVNFNCSFIENNKSIFRIVN